jgi:hypothetical protein
MPDTKPNRFTVRRVLRILKEVLGLVLLDHQRVL